MDLSRKQVDFFGKTTRWLTNGVAQEAAMEKLAPFTFPGENAPLDFSVRATVK